ncbi:MAG: glycosyltransferase [Pseudomonadaceae bacterium]|nr:glycosyltransferase [Pseudomonadaceae bacterium]
MSRQPPAPQPKIAMVIPCHNEASTIGTMVKQARKLLPDAEIVVCDNASDDATAAVAAKAGATVLHEARKGKGHAVRRLFYGVDADIYVMMDGDGTYDMAVLPKLLEQFRRERLAMLVGTRVETKQDCYRSNHRWGNQAFNLALRVLFGSRFCDVFSGYRIFSRGFVKSFATDSGGFTIESAMTVHALELRAACAEVPTAYGARPAGSVSKLSTWRDGLRILLYISALFARERPLACYGLLAGMLALLATGLFVPVLQTYLATGLVPRFPTLIVAGCMGLAAVVCVVAGVILQSIAHTRREAKQLACMAAQRF